MIRSSLVVLAAVVLLAGCAEQTSPTSSSATAPVSRPLNFAILRFDGVYQSPRQRQSNVEYWDYLRFYPDGIVVIGASQGTPENL